MHCCVILKSGIRLKVVQLNVVLPGNYLLIDCLTNKVYIPHQSNIKKNPEKT